MKRNTQAREVDESTRIERIAAEYWCEAADGRVTLVAQVCCYCGQNFLPKVAICSSCGKNEFKTAELEEFGTLYIFSAIHAAQAGFPVPYGIGYVDFPQNVRVFGHVKLDGPLPPRPDCRVAIEAADLFARPNGTRVRGYRFVPTVGESKSQ